MTIFLGYFFSYGFIILAFAISYVFQKLKLVKDEGPRKIIHILVCFTWVIMEKSFASNIHKVIIPLTFVEINWLSMKKHLIPGMDRKEDDTYGTVFYAISLTLMNLISCINSNFVISAGVGIFTLSFGDGFAAIFGKIDSKFNKRIKENKSLFGTTACFLFSILSILIVCMFMGTSIPFLYLILIALASTFFEFIGGKYDNLILPLGVFLITHWVVI